jgi:hypothetical protein
MKVEIQNQVIHELKGLALAFGLEDHWTLGLGLIRFLTGGFDAAHAVIQTSGAMLAGKIMDDSRFAQKLMRQTGMLLADEKMLRKELEGLTDARGFLLVTQVKEAAQIVPAMARGLKSFAETLPSPPGRLPKLTMTLKRAICDRIIDLQRDGIDLPDAKRQVAMEFKVSLSTVNRVWRQRAKLFQRG